MSADPVREGEAPGFGRLLLANAKVVLAVSVMAVFAYLIWLGLRALFPDVAWLQAGR